MALIKSTILAQISGSINGTTFSHNRGGAYARNRSMVSNPATARQNEVRTALASIADMWKSGLTQAQRDGWNSFGSSQQVVNRVGDTITLSGIAAFQRVNLFRVSTLNMGIQLDPVAYSPREGTFTPSFVSAEWRNTGTPEVIATLTAEIDNYFGLVCYYSADLSPGIKFFRGPYVGRTTVTTTAAPPPNEIPVTWPGMPTESGHNIALRFTLYDTYNYLPLWTVHTAPLATTDPAP